jgi:hypothetical protein
MSSANLVKMTMDATTGHYEHVTSGDGNSMFLVRIEKMRKTGLTLIDLTFASCIKIKQEEEEEEEKVVVEEEGPLFGDSDDEEGGYYPQQGWDSNNGEPKDHVGKFAKSAILISEFPRKNKVEFENKYREMTEEYTWDKHEDPDYEMK